MPVVTGTPPYSVDSLTNYVVTSPGASLSPTTSC